MQTGRFAVVRWIGDIITSLTMPTLALLFLVAWRPLPALTFCSCASNDGITAALWRLSGPSPIVEVSPRHHALQRRLVTHTRLGFRRYVTVGPPTGSFARLSNLPNTYRARGNVEPGAAADGRADPTTDMRGRGASGARTGSRCRQRGPAGAASTKPTAKTRTCCRCAQPTSADCDRRRDHRRGRHQ